MSTPQKAMSNSPIEEEAPVTPPRPRILCPGCSTELTIHQTVGTNEAFMYATKVDMNKLGLECTNEACPIHIEGTAIVNKKIAANPNIIKYVDMAKKERAAIEAAEKQAEEETKKQKREEEKAEYAKYDPFSGEGERKAMEAALQDAAVREEQQSEEDKERVARAFQQVQEGVWANLEKMQRERQK